MKVFSEGGKALNLDWKDTSGRRTGTSSYEFGDLSRSFARSVTSCVSPSGNQSRGKEFQGDIGDAWRMFFDQAYACGQAAVAEGTIAVADIEEAEPYLFIGLPGLTLLELVVRSIPAQEGTLVLASGAVLSRDRLPEGQGSAELFAAVTHAVQELKAAAFNEADLIRLRRAVLRAEGDVISSHSSHDTTSSRNINTAASLFQNMAIDISQLPFFRAHFLEVLERISSG